MGESKNMGGCLVSHCLYRGIDTRGPGRNPWPHIFDAESFCLQLLDRIRIAAISIIGKRCRLAHLHASDGCGIGHLLHTHLCVVVEDNSR